MARLFFGVTTLVSALFAAVLLGGCPIYTSPGETRVCIASGCFDCPFGNVPADGTCIPWACGAVRDCPSGYICGATTTGTGLACIAPLASSPGDCSAGCPTGSICRLAAGRTQCIALIPVSDAAGSSADGAVDAGATEAAADAPFEAQAVGLPAPDAPSFTDVSNAPDSSVDAPNDG